MYVGTEMLGNFHYIPSQFCIKFQQSSMFIHTHGPIFKYQTGRDLQQAIEYQNTYIPIKRIQNGSIGTD